MDQFLKATIVTFAHFQNNMQIDLYRSHIMTAQKRGKYITVYINSNCKSQAFMNA